MTIRIGLIGGGGIAAAHIEGYNARRQDRHHRGRGRSRGERQAARGEQAGGDGNRTRIIGDARDRGNSTRSTSACHTTCTRMRSSPRPRPASTSCVRSRSASVAEEAADVRKAVTRAGVTLMCAHNQLFMPAVAKAKELLDAGTIGDGLRGADHRQLLQQLRPEPTWAGGRATRQVGGGELIDTGYHPTYLMLHLAGGLPVEATAMLSTHRLKFMEGEDSAQVLVRFADGRSVTSSRPGPISRRLHRALLGGRLRRRVVERRHHPVARQARRGPGHESSTVSTRFRQRSPDFARRLTTGERPIHNQVEGINVLKVILGAYQSVEEKRTVTLADM